jgi:putative aldouronate transport system substrate-binding protein
VHAGWDYNTVSWNYDTKKYELTGESDGYKKTVTYLNKLVTEGLLDPESFTQSDDQARQKLAQGKSFVISGQVQDVVNNYSKDVSAIPGAKMNLIPMLTGPFGEKIFGGRLENGIAFPASIKDSPNFVAILQFCDWLFFSDEGQEFAKWGLQGTTYTKDSSGKRTLDPGITMLGFNAGAPKQLQKDFGVYNGAFVYGGTSDLDTSFYSQAQKDFIAASLNGRTIVDLPPPAPLNDDETQQVSFITQPLMDHIMTETLRFITGQRPLSDWDKFVKEQNDLKAQDYLNITNTAEQRFASQTGSK